MSQSPTDPLGALTRYRQGWKALNRLLHEERSFSGNEKNCAFLNLRDGQFASISSVSGLDFNDDSRALALCDWDFDGRIDLWMSARTAPRVRFMHNQNTKLGHFIAVQLRGNGTTTNRDAIGARVEIVTHRGAEKSILSLHASDGFLTQSTRWLHFGLGDSTEVKAIRVRWPGGSEEVYENVTADAFYVIDQASGEVDRWNPIAARKPIVAIEQALPASSQIARIIPPYHLPLPSIDHVDSTGGKQRLRIETPTLVSVWSASCMNCIREFNLWSGQATAFREHGLAVIAINADINAKPEEIARRELMLKEMGFPFPSLTPTEDTLRNIDFFQRALLDLWQPMPVPCSFLLDQFGRVVAVYKGPVELQQVWEDVNLINAEPERLQKLGLPFAGRWGSAFPKADPMRVSSQMIDHTEITGAIDYLQLFLDVAERAGSNLSKVRRADVQYTRSVLLESVGRSTEAIRLLETSRELNPSDYRVRTDLAKHYLKQKKLPAAEKELVASLEINATNVAVRRNLAAVLLQQDKLPAATEQLEILLQQTPNDANAHFNLGNAKRKSGHWAEAIKHYRSAVELRPNFVLAANNLAWIMATHPDDLLRDGQAAARLAERVCEQTQFQQPMFLDTLAAAYAETGDFAKAVETLSQAIKLLETDAKSQQDSQPLIQRRELYRKQQPYRESV